MFLNDHKKTLKRLIGRLVWATGESLFWHLEHFLTIGLCLLWCLQSFTSHIFSLLWLQFHLHSNLFFLKYVKPELPTVLLMGLALASGDSILELSGIASVKYGGASHSFSGKRSSLQPSPPLTEPGHTISLSLSPYIYIYVYISDLLFWSRIPQFPV